MNNVTSRRLGHAGGILVRIVGFLCCTAGILLFAVGGACAVLVDSFAEAVVGLGLGSGFLLLIGFLAWTLVGGRVWTLLLSLLPVLLALCLLAGLLSELGNIKGPLN